MSEFDLKESVGESKKTTVQRSIKHKIFKVLLLVLLVVICYLLGYFVGTKIGEKDKNSGANNSEVKNDNSTGVLDNQDAEEEEDTIILLTEDEALELAEDLYFKGIKVHFCGGGFDLNFKNVQYFDDLEYYEITNWLTLRKLFTKEAKVKGQLESKKFYSIDETVVISDNKYYSYECARGSNCSYAGTTFSIVSIESDIIIFDANSKYCDGCYDADEECEYTIETEKFIIEKEDNEWKISQLVYPNN